MAHYQHAQGCQTNPTLRVSQASEFSPTTNPGPLGTRSTAPSSHPPHMPMCLSRPSHLHSHTAVSLSVCQPRFQSVSPVNDKTFGKSISFFLKKRCRSECLCSRHCASTDPPAPWSLQTGRTDSFWASATQRIHSGMAWQWICVHFPLNHCLPPAPLPRAAALHQLLMGSQAILITELVEKQYSKQKQNKNTALGLWFSNFSVSSPLCTSKIEDPWKFLLMGVTSIYLYCIRNVNQDHF